MPRYKYTCGTCKLDDVRQINYDNQKQPICFECKNVLERKFVKPPKEWFNNNRPR